MPKPTNKKTETKKPTPSKALTPPKAPQPLSPDVRNLAEQDAGAGQEGMTSQDMSIPRLSILQDLSKQVKKQEPEYIKGAETGQICDAVTETLWDGETGILVVPISYRRAHLEWKPDRGGFVKDHGVDDAILAKCTKGPKGENILPDGNRISVSAEYFIFLINEETGAQTPYLVSMSGSQMKKARRWNTTMNQFRVPKEGGGDFNPAMFYRAYRLTTIPEKNDRGSWFGWKVTPEINVLDMENGGNIYLAAREFRKQVAAGAVTAAAPHEPDGDPTRDDKAPM